MPVNVVPPVASVYIRYILSDDCIFDFFGRLPVRRLDGYVVTHEGQEELSGAGVKHWDVLDKVLAHIKELLELQPLLFRLEQNRVVGLVPAVPNLLD